MSSEEDTKKLALAFASYSIYYLCLAENVFQEMVNQGNPHVISGDHPITDYDEQTKWSDFNIGIPSLFSFYHGLELIMKGMLLLMGDQPGNTHKLTELFRRLKSYEIDQKIFSILERYLTLEKLNGSPVGNWMTENSLSIDDLYEQLRYPVGNRKRTLRNDWPLKYQEERALGFVKELIVDSLALRVRVVALHLKFDPD